MKRHNIIHTLSILACTGVVGLLQMIVVMPLQAQNGFNIPFSQFGMGSMEQPYNLPMATRMGGAIYNQSGSNFINPFNPASYGSIESESFVFDMGIGLQTSVLRDENDRLFDADGNVGYLLMGMPITRWWKIGLGLMPYSTVNYESVSLGVDPTYPDTVKTIYDGNGGISQAFLGMAFNVLRSNGKRPDIQVGFNVNYLTGYVDRAISYTFMHNDSSHFFMPKRRYKQTRMSNFTIDFGLQARQPLGEHYTLGLGLVYKPYLDMKVNDMAIIYTYHAVDESLVDTIFPAPGGNPEFESDAIRPHTLGIGLSLVRNKSWQLAMDATFADWNGMKYIEGQTPSVFGTSSLNYGPFARYAIAFERIGNMDASTYWGRISWSLGVHHETGLLYLNMGGTHSRIDEWGGGAGVTMPMRKGRSLLTISIGYSNVGTQSILQRNTLTFGIAVSSCERWFFKRKYD